MIGLLLKCKTFCGAKLQAENFFFILNFYIIVYVIFRFGPYFVEPVIAGLDPKTSEPFIASLDLIGCPMITEDFVVSGTCSEQMYGMCETLYKPDQVCNCISNLTLIPLISSFLILMFFPSFESYEIL